MFFLFELAPTLFIPLPSHLISHFPRDSQFLLLDEKLEPGTSIGSLFIL